jgi:site-specific DNA-adenine methylase
MGEDGMIAKPIVMWAGGKTRLLPELMSRVPPRMRTYAEPFAGGAALFFALASVRALTFLPQRHIVCASSDAREEGIDHAIAKRTSA